MQQEGKLRVGFPGLLAPSRRLQAHMVGLAARSRAAFPAQIPAAASAAPERCQRRLGQAEDEH